MAILLISPLPELRARWRQATAIGASRLVEANAWRDWDGEAGPNGPELVLLHQPHTRSEGLGTIRALRLSLPETRLMVLTDRPNEPEGIGLLKLGVMGYCNSHIAPELLNKAVLAVRAGEVWAGRKLIQRLIENLGAAAIQRPPVADNLDGLTSREREVAELVGHGQSNKSIASALEISERTVKSHLSSIFDKAGIQDRLQLALLVNRRARTKASTIS